MFKDMSILKLSEFVKYKTAGVIDVQFSPRYLTDSVAKEVYQVYILRVKEVFCDGSSNLKAMCLSVYGVKLWNTLPGEIKNCTNVDMFKKCLKKHFLSHYYTKLHYN